MKVLRRFTATALCALGLTAGIEAYAQFPSTVLVEDFSSVTCVNCPQAAEIVKKMAEENSERVLTIQWHYDIPGRNDPFYAANKPHNDAREDYYGGFNALPQVYVNGAASVGTSESTVRADVDAAMEEESPIAIIVTQERSENDVDVHVTIESDEQGLPNGYRLHLVAVEGMVHRTRDYFLNVARSQPYYEETEFRDLFRTFVSTPEGVEVAIDANETKEYDFSYQITGDWVPEEMYVIAWVQDEFSSEIIQVGSSPKPPSLGVYEENAMAGYSFGLPTPNPAGDKFHLGLTLGAGEDAIIVLHDANGEEAKKVELGRLEEGAHEIEVATADLPAGAYTVTLQAGRYRATQKLTVVK